MKYYVDARGLICPLPVLKTRKVLLTMNNLDVVHITATDKATLRDFPLFCAETGHFIKEMEDKGPEINIVIECRK